MPTWLTVAVLNDPLDFLYEAPDGTWAVYIDHWISEPILGLPTREIAERVVQALKEAEQHGAETMSYSD